jgi:hypothetical protein
LSHPIAKIAITAKIAKIGNQKQRLSVMAITAILAIMAINNPAAKRVRVRFESGSASR